LKLLTSYKDEMRPNHTGSGTIETNTDDKFELLIQEKKIYIF